VPTPSSSSPRRELRANSEHHVHVSAGTALKVQQAHATKVTAHPKGWLRGALGPVCAIRACQLLSQVVQRQAARSVEAEAAAAQDDVTPVQKPLRSAHGACQIGGPQCGARAPVGAAGIARGAVASARN
jgi:hypothetical protein